MGRAVSRSPKDLPGTIHHDDTGVRQCLGGHSLGMPREQANPDAHRSTLPQLTLKRGRSAGTFVGVLPVTSWALCRICAGGPPAADARCCIKCNERRLTNAQEECRQFATPLLSW